MMGQKLTADETAAYKKLYLSYLEAQMGVTLSIPSLLRKDYPEIDIRWDYYQATWRKNDLTFKYEFEAIKNLALGQIENLSMRDALTNQSTRQWILSRKHPDYSEKVETTVTNNNPVQLNIIAPNDGKAIDGIPIVDKKELGESNETD